MNLDIKIYSIPVPSIEDCASIYQCWGSAGRSLTHCDKSCNFYVIEYNGKSDVIFIAGVYNLSFKLRKFFDIIKKLSLNQDCSNHKGISTKNYEYIKDIDNKIKSNFGKLFDKIEDIDLRITGLGKRKDG